MKKYNFQIIILSLAIILSIVAVVSLLTGKSRSGPEQKAHTGSSISHSVDSKAGEGTAAEEPQEPLVIIDPGHGGWEPGAGNGSINEKDVVLDISLEIEKVLIEKKINYYMIRTDDTYYSLEDRAMIANEKKASLFVSIHNNSFTDAEPSGILTAYNPYSTSGKKIAQIMQSKLKELGMRDRDISSRPNLYVLNKTEMPSILLEIGFLSNKKDLEMLTEREFQKKCAKQVVAGIEDILDELGLSEDQAN